MLAERFSPDFYEQIARLAAIAKDGKPEALARFEDQIRAPAGDDDELPAGKDAKKPARAKSTPPPAEVEDWAKSEWAKGWAAIEPALSGVDLRPYVFVTRDKRSSLGGLAAASHLEGLVDKLMGPRMMARGASQEIAKLVGTEPEEVFEAIRGRILQTDNFGTEPKGVQGLIALVETHGSLQRRLLGFVRDLPAAKAGAWAATSWSTCFADAAVVAEFTALLRGWSEQNDNKVLQMSAQGVLKLKKV
jgi:hypothetical protein